MFALNCLTIIFIFTTVVTGFKNNNGKYQADSDVKIVQAAIYETATNNKSRKRNVARAHDDTRHVGDNNNHASGQVDATQKKFAPKFKHPSKLFHMDMKPAGSSIRLRCAADGNPTPNVTWYKNNETIARRYLPPSYGKWSVSLDDLTKTDNGNYTCLVCNELGCINHTVVLQVQERYPSKPYIKEGYPGNKTVAVSDTAQLSCPAISDLEPYVYWVKAYDSYTVEDGAVGPNELPIPNGIKIESDDSNDRPEILMIYNVTKEDEGWYFCVAINTLGKASAKGYLTVMDQPLYSKPVLVRAVFNQTTPVGETAHFSFPFHSGMSTHIYWMHFKKDEDVSFNNFTTNLENNRRIVESDDPNERPENLTIFNVTKEDEGWYVCVSTPLSGRMAIDALIGETLYSKEYLTVFDPIPGTAVPDRAPIVTSSSKPITYLAAIAAVMTLILAIVLAVIVKLKRDKQKVIQTTRELMSEQWTKIISIERVLSYGNDDGTHTLRMPVVRIEKQKLIDVKKNYTYSVLPSEYVLPLDSTWEISKQDVTLQKVLGEGEFGKVMKAECFGLPNSSTSLTVAVKMLKDGHSEDDMIAFVSEMEIMKMVGKHENIVNLLGCCTQVGAPYIIVEYAENGCLREFLKKHKHGNGSTELKQRELVNFALQVANGMEFLVKRGCVHRDLAARNVLVSGARVLKVADFGLARDVRDSDYYRKHTPGKLPLKWMAPESICDNYYNNRSDVWSFGILTWEIMTLGDTPYQHVPAHYLYHYLKLGKRVEKPTSCSEEIYDLIKHCCTFNPDGRPTFTEIKEKLQAIELKTLD